MTRLATVLHRWLLMGLLALGLSALAASLTITVLAQAESPTSQIPKGGGLNWIPADGTHMTFSVTWGQPPTVVVTVNGLYPLNPNSAKYAIIKPDNQYTPFTAIGPGSIAMINSGFSAVMTVTPPVYLYGSGQQLFFYIDYVSPGNGSFTALYPVALNYPTYLPKVARGTGLVSGNGTNPCVAIAANPQTQYPAAPDSTYKFFSLVVPTTATVNLVATNVDPSIVGQLALRTPLLDNACSPTSSTATIDYAPSSAVTTLSNSPLAPGTYFARVYVPGATSNVPYSFSWSYTPAVPAPVPNDQPCQVQNAPSQQNTLYWAKETSAYNFYRIDIASTSTVYLTVTDFTATGSGTGQLQLRQPNGNFGACDPILSTTTVADAAALAPPFGSGTVISYNVPPGTYYARVNITPGTETSTPYGFSWTAIPGARPFEPNFTSCTAAPVSPGTTYSAYPDAIQQWFYFDWNQTAPIVITMTNYSASGQAVLYQQQGADCSGPMGPIDVESPGVGFPAGQLTLASPGAVTQGRYYIYVATLSGGNSTNLYNFYVNPNVLAWAPNINTCTPMPPNNYNCPANMTNGTLPVYWVGAPGATSIQVQLFALASYGMCPAGTGNFDSGVITGISAPSGSRPFSGFQTGYYSANLYITGPQGTFSRTNMSIKMNCEFLANLEPSLLPSPIGPQQAVTIVPANRPAIAATIAVPPDSVPHVHITPAP